MQVGSLVRLKREILGNPKGSLAVCYEEYNIGRIFFIIRFVRRPRIGYSFIFKNGCCDGFASDEIIAHLDEIGICPAVCSYIFTNLGQLAKDFKAGYFNPAFREHTP